MFFIILTVWLRRRRKMPLYFSLDGDGDAAIFGLRPRVVVLIIEEAAASARLLVIIDS